jgi:transposase-like protein
MHRIVSSIKSLQQHIEMLFQTPEVYRPQACPHCGLSRLWRHGCYYRKAGRGSAACNKLNPIPIPRFCCQGCRHTCSRLPACIAPRRWYAWAVQQQVLLMRLAGYSLHGMSLLVPACRHTLRRWWQWLAVRSSDFGFHLRSCFPELGRATDWRAFWRTCLERMPLSEVMAWLDQHGVSVP